MQPGRGPARAPGSFSPLPSNSNNNPSSSSPRPSARRVESFSSDDTTPLNVVKARNNHQNQTNNPTPIFASFTSQPNSSTHSLQQQQQQNFSRPTLSTAQAAARSVASFHSPQEGPGSRPGMSPLSQNPQTTSPSVSSFSAATKGHSRKHSASAGLFDSTLPSTSTSNLSQVGSMAQQPSPKMRPQGHRELSASQIAAQAAFMHQNQQQAQQQAQMNAQQQQHQQQYGQQQGYPQHNRQRSQTVPTPGGGEFNDTLSSHKRGSGGPLNPPLLSLTEASAPRESGFGNQGYHNGLLGSHTAAATAAANVVFPRSGQSSPKLPPGQQPHAPPALVTTISADKPVKAEKTKVKLFSRPGKISIKSGDPRDKPLPSPGRSIGHALSSLQRGNFSTTSLDSSAQSFYSLANSSTATIKASEQAITSEKERDGKEAKEKKHHFLSRGKHKLKEKDDFHLPLSSANSNSRPTDPSAPSSLYSFNLPPSPGPNSAFKMSSLGSSLGTGSRKSDKKKDDKFDDTASSYGGGGHVSRIQPVAGYTLDFTPPIADIGADDAWPYIMGKILVIFEGEQVRTPIEDMNAVVRRWIVSCIARRNPMVILDGLRELLHTGFSSMDHTLREMPEDRLIPKLADIWVYTNSTVVHFIKACFLPLDQEFYGQGSLMSYTEAREFWAKVPNSITLAEERFGYKRSSPRPPKPAGPIHTVLEVRRITLMAFRDVVILSRYDQLKSMMSRTVLESLPQGNRTSPIPVPSSGPGMTQSSFNLSTSPADSTYSYRPGTAASLDPSTASYNSTGTTLLPESSASSIASRSRAISNVSFTSSSDHSNNTRPFTPSTSSAHATTSSGAAAHNQNVEDSKEVTLMVARLLQCLSLIIMAGHQNGCVEDEGHYMVEELNKLLKLNWLGRGRMGRNRRGIVGGRVRRGTGAGAPGGAAGGGIPEE
ncbi:HbrB-like-domain-containing protein [Coniochaeta sp. 2T2.1]|nr:HbrB-like-domain-containing protein [Coniochaeta sp. 2T2.1]